MQKVAGPRPDCVANPNADCDESSLIGHAVLYHEAAFGLTLAAASGGREQKPTASSVGGHECYLSLRAAGRVHFRAVQPSRAWHRPWATVAVLNYPLTIGR